MSGQGGVMARLQRLDEGHSHCGWGVGDGIYHLDTLLMVKKKLTPVEVGSLSYTICRVFMHTRW